MSVEPTNANAAVPAAAALALPDATDVAEPEPAVAAPAAEPRAAIVGAPAAADAVAVATAVAAPAAEPRAADAAAAAVVGAAAAAVVAEAELPQPRRARPTGARCDARHERGARVVRSRDGLVTVCVRCARGVDVAASDSADAIAAVVNRSPAAERRVLMRRLLARRALHTARRDRKALSADR